MIERKGVMFVFNCFPGVFYPQTVKLETSKLKGTNFQQALQRRDCRLRALEEPLQQSH